MRIVRFIDLGNICGPVAGHIQRAGFPMVVDDLRPDPVWPKSLYAQKVWTRSDLGSIVLLIRTSNKRTR